jgi:hypothetical protein
MIQFKQIVKEVINQLQTMLCLFILASIIFLSASNILKISPNHLGIFLAIYIIYFGQAVAYFFIRPYVKECENGRS